MSSQRLRNGGWVLVGGLVLFNVAIVALMILPMGTLVFSEAVVASLAALFAVGLLLHASQRVHVPGEQWSYLGTAWLGTITMGGFLALIPADAPIAYRASVPLFLLSGVALAVGAHVMDGAVPRGPFR